MEPQLWSLEDSTEAYLSRYCSRVDMFFAEAESLQWLSFEQNLYNKF